MIKETIKIKDMSCSHCVKSVEQELSNLTLNNFNVTIGEVTVDYSEELISREQIKSAIEEAGYEVEK